MLHLHRSTAAEALVAGLGEVLAEPPEDPFTPEVVAVPARGVERWLAQRLSHLLGSREGAGICANVHFLPPGRLLDDALRAADGGGRVGADPWDPERAVWPLLQVLDEAGSRPLRRPPGGDRRYPVAARLAAIFAGYGQERPAMLRRWAAGADGSDTGEPLPLDLQWQPELWRALRAAIGEPSPAERLPAALDRLARDPAVVDLPGRLSFYGLTRLSTARLAALAALARRREVHLWLQHASPELWARLATGTPARHPMLASMSRDAQALQRRLLTVAPDLTDHLIPDPQRPATLLGALQNALSADEVAAAAARPLLDAADASVSVHACHGRARQVEVLRETILARLAADPSLEPRDVLVMCPDIEEFAPLVAAAFGLGEQEPTDPDRPAHPAARLRVRLADRALTAANPLFGTLATVLELADGRVRAADVLDLAGTAAVRRRFSFDDEDLDRLADWITAAGVSWGLDAGHRDRYALGHLTQGTWRDGLDRILLGVTMECDRYWLGATLPLDDVDSTDIELAGRLAELVDRLDAAVGALSVPQSVAAWTDAMGRAVLGLAAPARGAEWQAAALVGELAELRADADGYDVPLSPADMRALVAGRLAGRPTRAGFRTGTLTVSTMVPMRSVPHRVIALLGLDDTAFPRAGVTDGDDLLARAPRRPGERDPRTEDRQLLLDAVCAAGEHLIVVYSGADERTGVTVPPSVPLGELLDALDTAVRTPDGRPARDHVTTRHPLQPFDPRNFGVHDHNDQQGAADDRRTAPAAAPMSFDLAALAGARALLRPRQPRPGLVDGPLPAAAPVDVSLRDLTALLGHPARGFLRQRLEVGAGGRAVDLADALPIELDELARYAIGDRFLAMRLRDFEPDLCLELETRRGCLPPGALGIRTAREIGSRAEAIATLARSDVDLGEPDAIDIALDLPGDRPGEAARRLTGTVSGVRADARVRVRYATLGPRDRIEAWVELLALTAAHPDRAWRAVIVGRKKDDGARRTLGPVDPATARETLTELVAMREAGLQAPLPMPLKTAEAYAASVGRGGRPQTALQYARTRWEGGQYPGENADPEHELIFGRGAPIDALGTDRLADLACRVWAPLQAAEGQGR